MVWHVFDFDEEVAKARPPAVRLKNLFDNGHTVADVTKTVRAIATAVEVSAETLRDYVGRYQP